MSLGVISTEFYLLEGLSHENELTILAVGFDKAAMIGFALEVGQKYPGIFKALRITTHGDILEAIDQPTPTHEAPIRLV